MAVLFWGSEGVWHLRILKLLTRGDKQECTSHLTTCYFSMLPARTTILSPPTPPTPPPPPSGPPPRPPSAPPPTTPRVPPPPFPLPLPSPSTQHQPIANKNTRICLVQRSSARSARRPRFLRRRWNSFLREAEGVRGRGTIPPRRTGFRTRRGEWSWR